MFELNNFVTAGKFFLVIAGELVLIFVAVSFLIGLLTEDLPPVPHSGFSIRQTDRGAIPPGRRSGGHYTVLLLFHRTDYGRPA